MKTLEEGKPNIFEYQDSRSYLNDIFAYLKQTQSAFSYRFFSKQSGIPSAGFIKLVLDGKRNIASDSMIKFSKGLKHTKEESEFFESLVLFTQADKNDQKSRYFEKMVKIQRQKNVRILEADQFEYWSNWYCPALRELIGLEHFKEDPSWIAETMIPRITPAQARRALELLQRLNLVERDEQGRLRAKDGAVSSGAEVVSLAVSSYHKQMIQSAMDAIEEIRGKERDISSVTMTMNDENMQMVKEEIKQFRRRLLALAEDKAHEHNRVYQLNVQLFPLTKKSK